jgi:membrane-bound metal-dependent hydrolase YbcI (DUF457 family)
MTNGGRGVGFFIPFSNRRYFLPFRPIRVSPIGAEHFAAKAGVVLAPVRVRRARGRGDTSATRPAHAFRVTSPRRSGLRLPAAS